MTRVTSFNLFQCSECGQRHVLPNYGSVSGYIPRDFNVSSDSLRVCQRCSSKKPLRNFIPLGVIYKPERDSTPKFLRKIRKILDKNYKGEEPYPSELYPDLDIKPFDAAEYFPPSVMKYYETYGGYPNWYVELRAAQIKER